MKIYEHLKDKLSDEFQIAQCNNFFTFYELLEEEIVRPVVENQIATEEEVDQNFNQRSIFI